MSSLVCRFPFTLSLSLSPSSFCWCQQTALWSTVLAFQDGEDLWCPFSLTKYFPWTRSFFCHWTALFLERAKSPVWDHRPLRSWSSLKPVFTPSQLLINVNDEGNTVTLHSLTSGHVPFFNSLSRQSRTFLLSAFIPTVIYLFNWVDLKQRQASEWNCWHEMRSSLFAWIIWLSSFLSPSSASSFV